jgi:hypothetical protein
MRAETKLRTRLSDRASGGGPLTDFSLLQSLALDLDSVMTQDSAVVRTTLHWLMLITSHVQSSIWRPLKALILSLTTADARDQAMHIPQPSLFSSDAVGWSWGVEWLREIRVVASKVAPLHSTIL